MAGERGNEELLRIRAMRFGWPGAPSDCLDIAELDIARGELVFLHGPSGSGKTSLLGLAGGVSLPRDGELRLLGTRWSDLPAWRRDAFRAAHVGYIFQQFNLLPFLSTVENVLLPCRLSRVRESNALRSHDSPRAQAEALLDAMGLPKSAWLRAAAELSVGQQQRVAAARALIGLPELVLADEPTSALDEARRDAFLALLVSACRSAGAGLVFVSHDLRLASRFDRSVFLPEINRASVEEAA